MEIMKVTAFDNEMQEIHQRSRAIIPLLDQIQITRMRERMYIMGNDSKANADDNIAMCKDIRKMVVEMMKEVAPDVIGSLREYFKSEKE